MATAVDQQQGDRIAEVLQLIEGLRDLNVATRDGDQQDSSSSTSTGQQSNPLEDLINAISALETKLGVTGQTDMHSSDKSNDEARVYTWLETKDGKLTGIQSAADLSTTSKWDDIKWCAAFERELKTRIVLDPDEFARWKDHFRKKPSDVETWWSTRVLSGINATWADRGLVEEKITFVLKTQKDLLDDLANKSKDGDHQVKFVTNAYNAHAKSHDEDGN